MQTGRKADRQACIHADRQAGRQGDSQHMQTGRKADNQIDRQICIQAGRLAARHTGREIGRKSARPAPIDRRKFETARHIIQMQCFIESQHYTRSYRN